MFFYLSILFLTATPSYPAQNEGDKTTEEQESEEDLELIIVENEDQE